MPQFFILLLKINLVLLLFAGGYYLILRRLTFYNLNRLFLVFGILFSSVYPFIDLTELFYRYGNANSVVPQINEQVAQLNQAGTLAGYWQVIIGILVLGALVMCSRLAFQFLSLYRIHKRSHPGQAQNYPVRILRDELSPFSFWKTIYVNPALHEKDDLNNILRHEQVHVQEWHTLDIILAELAIVFYWFNPGVWLMKRAVRENLEFITDQRIIAQGVDKKGYQYSLLNAGALYAPVAVVNNFNLADLKKRIRMMNARRSSRLTLSRYLFLLPVLLLTTLAFTVSKRLVPVDTPRLSAKSKPAPTASTITLLPAATSAIPKKVTRPQKKATSLTLAAPADTARKILLFHAIRISTDSTGKKLDHPVGDGLRTIHIQQRITDKNGPGPAWPILDSIVPSDIKRVTVMVRRDGPPGEPPKRNIFIEGAMPSGLTNESLPKKDVFILNGKNLSKEAFEQLLREHQEQLSKVKPNLQ